MTMNPQNNISIQRNKDQFFLKRSGRKAAFIDYRIEGEDLIIEHTEVKLEWRGMGMGKMLVGAVVDYSEEQGFELKSECGYAADIIEKYYLSA